MTMRTFWRRVSAIWVCSVCCLGFAAPASALIEIVGRKIAFFEWAPATGPVAQYLVYVERNSSGERQLTLVRLEDDRYGGVTGNYGDTLQVWVRARALDGTLSGYSQPSEPVRFVAVASEPDPDPQPEPDPPPAGQPAASLDFDGDRRADLLLQHPSNGDLDVWLLDDAGLREVRQAESLPASATVVGNADYDGDGHADLLWHDAGAGRLGVRLLVGGAKVDETIDPIGTGWEVVGSADYDGNGYADVLLRNGSSMQVWSLYGSQPLGSAPYGAIIASGDYDHDGQHDVLWYNRWGKEPSPTSRRT
jgi:hypothetical protein